MYQPATEPPTSGRQLSKQVSPKSFIKPLQQNRGLSDEIDMNKVEYAPNSDAQLTELKQRQAETLSTLKLPDLGDPRTNEAQRQLIHAVDYMNEQDRADVLLACRVGAQAHHGVQRKSGEPYITHPIAVAEILAGFRLSRDTIVAAILHDTVEDTSITFEDVRDQFGEPVARLVDGVTKLKSSNHNKAQNKAATFHKIISATLEDPRVLVIKLADRLHNMSTLGAVPAQKRKATATETMQFYVPFARLMGLNDLADYIEILCYRNLDIELYSKLDDKLLQQGLGRQMQADAVLYHLTRQLDKLRLSGHVRVLNNQVRLYRQFFKSRANINALLRHYEFEIVLQSVADCHLLAEHLIKKYDIAAENIADNISRPLPGGNQSFTLLYQTDSEAIKVTILTRKMQETARLGVLAMHNASQLSRSVIQASLNNMKDLLATNLENQSLGGFESSKGAQDNLHDSQNIEQLVDVTERLLSYFNARKIVCYTPQGDAHELPRGSTALDFAYAVGPKVGNVATGAMIDGVEAKLGSILQSGQVVNIHTDASAKPKAEWLGIVVSNKARSLIQEWLKHLPEKEQQHYGEQSLQRALQTYDKSLQDITESDWQDLLNWQNVSDKQALFSKISKGILLPQLVVSRLFSDEVAKKQADAEKQGIERPHQMLKDANGVEVHFAGCCYPIFGDPIIGHLTRGGLVVHRHQCYAVEEKQKTLTYEFVQLGWHSEQQVQNSLKNDSKRPLFTAFFKLTAILSDEQISQLVNTLLQEGIGIEDIHIHDARSITVLKVVVQSRQHLEHGMNALLPTFDFCEIKRMYRDNNYLDDSEDDSNSPADDNTDFKTS